jgi:hypothetical protein
VANLHTWWSLIDEDEKRHKNLKLHILPQMYTNSSYDFIIYPQKKKFTTVRSPATAIGRR